MDIFSAINFKLDRVIDGDFRILKDLVQSNLCEVSHNTKVKNTILKDTCEDNSLKIPIANDGIAGKDAVNCQLTKHQKNPSPLIPNELDRNAGINYLHLQEEHHWNLVENKAMLPDVVLARYNNDGANPKQRDSNSMGIPDIVNHRKSAYKENGDSLSDEDYLKSSVIIEKLLGSNDLGLNGMTKCLFNFLDYTEYFIGAFECLRCLQDNANNLENINVKKQLQTKIITDIQSSIECMRKAKIHNLEEHERYHCIMCAIVERNKCKDGDGSEHFQLSKETELIRNCQCGEKIQRTIIGEEKSSIGNKSKLIPKETEQCIGHVPDVYENQALQKCNKVKYKEDINVEENTRSVEYPLLDTHIDDDPLKIHAVKEKVSNESYGNRGRMITNRIQK